MVIPAGCTSDVQPVDIILNQTIKDVVRGLREDLMVHHANIASDGPSVSKESIVDWIVSANTMLNTQSSSVAESGLTLQA